MTKEREQQIVVELQTIVDAFEPTADEPGLTMFGLISRYNAQHDNSELIGGDWAAEHGFELPA